MSTNASTGPASPPPRRASWPIFRAAACSIRRWAISSPRSPTNIRASPRPAPARCGWKMPARAWLAEVIGYPETQRRHADLGRQHRQSDRHRRRPRGTRSGRRRRGLHDPLRPPLRRQGAAYRRARPRAEAADRHRRPLPNVGRRAGGSDGAKISPMESDPGWWSLRPAQSTPASVDPLDAIADLCRRHGVWFHVDGAYGGLFALCEEGRQKLRGIERADSVALDPHKTLFLPYGTGAVLVRDGNQLLHAFSASAEYIRPLGESEVGPSPADLSPELTRHFRASAPMASAPARRCRSIPRGAAGKAGAGPLFPRRPCRKCRDSRQAAARTCRSSPSAICRRRRRGLGQ